MRFFPIMVLLAGIIALVPQAQANKFGMAGCGLGTFIFSPGGGWFGQTSAATTNATFFNQGFGITSGTSNCLPPGKMAQVKAQQQFLVDNLPVLSKEMAQGEGEYLQVFSQTMGCQPSAYPKFTEQMQQSYPKIFRAPGAMAVLSAIRKEIKSNQFLNSHCDTVI